MNMCKVMYISEKYIPVRSEFVVIDQEIDLGLPDENMTLNSCGKNAKADFIVGLLRIRLITKLL